MVKVSVGYEQLSKLLLPPHRVLGAFYFLMLMVAALATGASEFTNTTAELVALSLTNTAPGLQEPLAFNLSTAPSGAVADTNGVITWTPTEAQGPSTNTLVMVISDGQQSITNNFLVMVTEVNEAPVAVTDNYAVTNGALTIGTPGVLADDTDSDWPANSLTATLISGPTNGVLNLSSNGGFVYTPNSGYSGADSFTYRVDDGLTNSAPAMVMLVVSQSGFRITSVQPATNSAIVTWESESGKTYRLLYKDSLAASWNVSPNDVVATGPTAQKTNALAGSLQQFYRVRLLTNHAPTLSVQSTQTVAELSLMTLANSATDADLPDERLTYALIDPPNGAAVDTNGLITWTPSEGQGPGTYELTTVAQDNGGLKATNSFTVVVTEVNAAPQLPSQSDAVASALNLLTVTNTATDSDEPANVLTYNLISAPLGAAVDPNGIITWTPDSNQAPSTNTFVTVVTDNGGLSATNSFVVVVLYGNVAPEFTFLPDDVTLPELSLLTVTNTATDAGPGGITYSLLDAPVGATIDTNGIISWTPTEAQGPATNEIVTVATDGGGASTTNRFFVFITELNEPAVAIADEYLVVGTNTLNIVAPGVLANDTDADLPANPLLAVLVSGPTNGVLNLNSNGSFDYTPGVGFAGDSFTYSVFDGTSNSAPATVSIGGTIAPVITFLTPNVVANAGEHVTLLVAATGTAPLSYQWYFNGEPLAGATGLSFSDSNVQPAEAGNYFVVVTNAGGSVTSAVTVLNVNVLANCFLPPPGMIGWWTGDGNASDLIGTNHGILQGGTTASTPGVVGKGFVMDGTNGYVQIANAPELNLTNLTVECWVRFDLMDTPGTSTLGAQYIVFKKNTRSTQFEGINLSKHRYQADIFVWEATSAAGIFTELRSSTVIQPGVWYHVAGVRGPNFLALYVNGQLEAQNTVSYAQDYANMPLYFGQSGQPEWEHKLGGAVDEVSLYNRALSGSEIAAIYAAGVAGKCKGLGLTISGEPRSKSVPVGTNTTLSVVVGGLAPFSYQWRFGGVPIPGATAANLTLTNLQFADSGNYTVVITNTTGSLTSSIATLTVMAAPAITNQPQNLTNSIGTTGVFSAGVSGTTPLTYRWQRNGVTVTNGGRFSGATTSALTITGIQAVDAGNFMLTVTNAVGVAASSVVSLTVNGPPVVTLQPLSQDATVGSNVTFTIAAAGTQPLSYQWRKAGVNIAGATDAVFTLLNVQTNSAGNFQVVITNALGAVTSSVAALTVSQPLICVSVPNNVIGWWPGDGNANDIFGHHATLQGGATAAGVGRVSQAFTFDGTNNFVQIADNPALRPTNFTVEAWVKFDALNSSSVGVPAGQQYIVFRQNTRPSSLFEGIYLGKERISGTDRFVFATYAGTGAGVTVNGTTAISVGVWYHLAAVRGSNSMQLYVNGQMQAQATATQAQDYGNYPFYFGTTGHATWDGRFRGLLDEVTIYNRPLSSNEIATIYSNGAGGKCKGALPPFIVTQPTNRTYAVGGTTSFGVVTGGSAPMSYQWFRDGFAVVNEARISGANGATLTVINMQPSDIANYTVLASNAFGTVLSGVASLNTGVPPANDNFSAATSIGGVSGSINGNNANATRQSGEPNHAGNAGPGSVWYNWTAPSTNSVTIDTSLSAFDTLLAVYTGTDVSALTLVTSNNNIGTNNSRSRVTFTPVAGTIYRIAVDGGNGANGNLTLRWIQANVALPDLTIFATAINPHITTENFAPGSCAVLEGLVAPGTRRIIRFDTQTANVGGANLVFGNPASNPNFVFASCHAHYHFQNYMSYRLRNSGGQVAAVGLKVGFCVLDVFRWDVSAPANALYTCANQGIQKGWGDLYDSTLDGQWIDITGLPDGNYTMEMEANPMGIIQESNYSNNITLVPIVIGNSTNPPPNDAFANAQMLLGTSPSVAGTTTNATKQAGEPSHAGNAGGRSIWYSWTAPATKTVIVDTIGSSFNTLLAVYTGTAVNSLTLVTNNDDIIPGGNLQSRVSFDAIAGTTYRIAVDGFDGVAGRVTLTANQTVANDNFSACIFSGGVQGTLSGSTVGATKESGEPNHAGNTGGHSIWYCWTAPISGTATFDTMGSTFNTTLAIYSGNTLETVALAASNDDINGGTNQSRVTFNAVGLTMYKIAIDGRDGDSGNTTLNWNLSAAAPSSAWMGSFTMDPNARATATDGRATLGFNLLPEGMCQVAITGQPQTRYRIERSCDLRTWVPLVTTVADFNGKAYFTDKAARHLKTGSSEAICGPDQILGLAVSPTEARFYRAIAVP